MDPVSTVLTIVGWLLSPLIKTGITALLEKWTNRIGLGNEFMALTDELKNIQSTLGSAAGFQTNNSSLLELLKDLQQLAYQADDLIDELDYYRIQDDIKLSAGNSRCKAPIALQKLGPYGGVDGVVRDMDATSVTHISNIGIRHGDLIDALILRYECFGWKERTDHWGGEGGWLTEITFQPNEYIVAITGHVGYYWNMHAVRSIKFVTNFRSYGPFGREEGIPFELLALGGQIVGLHVRCGTPQRTGRRDVSDKISATGNKSSATTCSVRASTATVIDSDVSVAPVAVANEAIYTVAENPFSSSRIAINAIGVYVKIVNSTGFSSPSSSGINIVTRAICSVYKQACCSSTEDDVMQLPRSIPSRSTMSHRMKNLVQQLRETSKNVCAALKLELAIATDRGNLDNQTTTNLRETTSHMTTKVYGRDQERNNLINLIEGDKVVSQTLSVISIVGHGGVGKTTLAQLVYNDLKEKTHFNLQMWVTVSINFDVKRLTKEILVSGYGSNYESISNLDKLQTTLKECLEEKRFLLVLDDLWEDKDTTNWEKLLAPLRNVSTKGNVVLVTTRKPGVANLDCNINFINLDGLEKDEYWYLFKAFTFGDENYEGHKNLQLIGREIVKKLKGNPLAARTVGALLNRDLDANHWRRVLEREEWKREDGVNSIMPALRISYEYLPFNLQRCFSYCALFPKDYKFWQRELINIWIAQGFLYVQGRRTKDVGKEYLHNLVGSGFFQKIDDKYGFWGEYIVIHDLLHDLAQNVSLDECLSADGKEIKVENLPTTRHLSIINESLYESDEMENGISANSNFENVEKYLEPGKLSTLMCFVDEGSIDPKTVEWFQNKFKDVNGLRVLRLQTIMTAKSLLSSLLDFTHLRHLQLCSNYSCDTLPEEICRLYHLQVLDVRNWKNLVKLPANFNNLINLRHFVPWNIYLYLLIAGVGKLAHLQELHLFGVRKEREFVIGQLKELKELEGDLRIDNLENVESREEAKGARLDEKAFLNGLQLSWENSDVRHAADVLDGLQPHPNLKELIITGYGGATPPRWLSSKTMPTYLEDIILFNCMALEILPPLGQLPFLKRLELKSMSNVKEIGPHLYGCGQHMAFQCLEVLKLQDNPKLAKWVWNAQCQNLPSLSKLLIWKCPELDLPLSDCTSETEFNQRFPHLDDLQIVECPKLLRMLHYLNNKESIIHPHDVGSFELFNISNSELTIRNPCHPRAWDDVRFQNLGTIIFFQICENRYPLLWENFCRSLPSLETLQFHTCPVLFTFSNEGLDTRMCFQFQSLKRFILTKCGITGKQISWILQHMPVLNEFWIQVHHEIKFIGVVTEMNDLNLIASPGKDEGFLQIPSSLTFLEKLLLSQCPNMIFGYKEGLSGLLSLRHLSIEKCSRLLASMVSDTNILPPGLQNLSFVNMPDGTTWFLEGLSSLAYLNISCSPALKSVDMASCSALEKLIFDDCPELSSLKGLESLARLKHLKVKGCPVFADGWISQSDIGFSMLLESLDIDTTGFLKMSICKQLTSLQLLTFHNQVVDLCEEEEESLLLLTSLKVIKFDGCINLKHLPAKLYLLPSVEKLIIWGCQNIQSLPENGLPKSLKKLEVELCGDEVKKMFEEYAKKLNKRR